MSIAEQYQIIKALGDQKVRRFGDVYFVESKKDGSKGVLKHVRKSSASQIAAERLRQEACFTFNHEGLPQTLDFYESESEVLLVRAYATGLPLHTFWLALRKKERIPFLQDFVTKLIPLFATLKKEGVVHCDLKPGNILIEGDISDFRVHLIDFGLALRIHDREERKLLFPLGYAAPELLLHHLDLVDQRTDIFALGIIIWRLFAGKLPLVHPNPSIYTNIQLTHPLPDDTSLPRGLYAILRRMSSRHAFQMPPNKMDYEELRACLRGALNERYVSLTEVAEDLNRLPKPRFYQRISFR
ncbi:MAG: hypothetical protein A3D92_22085 [Bacteroidetes bacterium RIFCSPHIGHO2_02_FULL_44_7]|nr:MAG: hypothetical protein A3D92_22085 [Bacteroidetes bacterium RIFCSPHIGHO2_02_FULL_44_7]